MKLVIFGLTVSSSWGNGHATLWRGLIRSLGARGHRVVFFERDVPYYANSRDLHELPGGSLCLYREWHEIAHRAERELADADAGMVTSFCPDAELASELVCARASHSVFYDMDTPVTLEALARGERMPYVPRTGYAGFDQVLSFSGGPSLEALREQLGARAVAPLYGSVDPEHYGGGAAEPTWRAAASYLGTYAADRQAALERLFLEPARRLPDRRFLLGGSQYPADIDWPANLHRLAHVPPPDHPAFYRSSPITINITRAPMARAGFCPSGRLFEAAACGVPVLSDSWPGLAEFFEPGREIFVCDSTEDALEVLRSPEDELAATGRAAQERVRAQHTADHRARELVELLSSPRGDARERAQEASA